jgi:hypothetical protein
MPSTPIYSLPYPANVDLVRDGHQDIQDLATASETTLNVLNGLVSLNPVGPHTNISFDGFGNGTPTVGASSFTIGNCFSTQYDAYKIVWTGGASTANNVISISYPTQTTQYYGNLLYNRPNASTPTSANDNNNFRHTWIGWGGSTIMIDAEFYYPFPSNFGITPASYVYARYIEFSQVAGAAVGTYMGWQAGFTQRPSVTFTLASGTISTSGRVRVYAYNV